MELTMEWQTILLIAWTLIAYTLVTLVIPSLVFAPKLKGLTFPIRMMGYYCIGNVIIINIVFTLEFLHISYRPTLILVTFLVYIYLYLHLRGRSVHEFFINFYQTVNQLSTKVITIRTIWARNRENRARMKAEFKRVFFDIFLKHIIEWLLLAALLGYSYWEFGTENLQDFGYHASDVVVHQYWINNLVLNNPFVAGVYPFGFHIIIYYLHAVFGIRMIGLLRIFGLVNLTFVLLNMCALMKSVFRQRYLPILGAFIYIGNNFFSLMGTDRFLSGLPQEHALIFMFPSVAFAIAYFHYKFLAAKPESVSPVEKKARKKLKSKAGSVRFAGAKNDRERREFERIAKQIARERGQEYKPSEPVKEKQKKTSEKEKKAASKRKGIEPSEIPEDEVGVITVSEVAGTVAEQIESAVADQVEAAVTEEVEAAEAREVDVALAVEEVQQQPAAEQVEKPSEPTPVTEIVIPVEGPVVKLKWYQKIWRGYLSLWNRVIAALGREESLIMFLFALAFSMTIAVHFYATIAAVFLYFGIALGFAGRFFRPRYFLPILKSILLGLLIAVLPFGVAMAMGTPLQGSLNWALSVMQPATTAADEEEDEEYEDEEEYTDDSEIDSEEGVAGTEEDIEEVEEVDEKPGVLRRFKNLTLAVKDYGTWLYLSTGNFCDYFLRNGAGQGTFPLAKAFFLVMGALLAAAIILFLPLREYSMSLFSVFFGLVFMDLLLLGRTAGLPEIMQAYRVAVFMMPVLGIGAAAAVDGVITVVLGWLHWKYVKWIPHLGAFAAVVVCVGAMYQYQLIRVAADYSETMSALMTNGAMICTERILAENPPKTYTVLSTVDEFQMVNLYGYHYEDIVLLHKLEKVNTDGSAEQRNFNIYQDNPEDPNDPNIYIPTKYVYIYIEKQPVGSSSDYRADDWKTSYEGAKYKTPQGTSHVNYQGSRRWIVMCKMSVWMDKIKEIYPEAVSVFYEDNDFICYRLSQGTIPYNLGVDFGYNNTDEELVIGDQ